MPTVVCPNNMCLYNDDFKGICTYDGCIHAEEECEAFTSYREESEYQEEFWIACEADGKRYRTKHRGKRVEIKGLILYTQDRLPPEEYWDDPRASIHCTEKETGYGLSLHNVFDPEKYECILKHKREFPNVMTLPEKTEVQDETD